MKQRGWIESRDYLLVQSGIPYAVNKPMTARNAFSQRTPN